jgi:nucleotide-binding universal stress UspA family protein
MPYKTILVHCDATPQTEQRLRYAVQLAKAHEARLVGLLVAEPLAQTAFVDTPFLPDMMRLHEQRQEERVVQVRETFERVMGHAGLEGEWRVGEGSADSVLATHIRYADLGVVGQFDPEGSLTEQWRALPETVAMTSGRPVLVVPYIGAPPTVARNVVLAWNASREATRAASDALPLLQAAERVRVLVVDARSSEEGHGEEPGADVAAWLARHGVKVEVQRDNAPDSDVGSVILSRLSDFGADLLVMGIFGHSRLRELVLGGASNTLLASMTVPVLIAH